MLTLGSKSILDPYMDHLGKPSQAGTNVGLD